MNLPSKSVYFAVFAALLALLAVTIAMGFVPLGRWNLPVAMIIAAAKAVLIILYFMNVRAAGKLLWLFVGAGFVWLAILISLVMTDYLTRGW